MHGMPSASWQAMAGMRCASLASMRCAFPGQSSLGGIHFSFHCKPSIWGKHRAGPKADLLVRCIDAQVRTGKQWKDKEEEEVSNTKKSSAGFKKDAFGCIGAKLCSSTKVNSKKGRGFEVVQQKIYYLEIARLNPDNDTTICGRESKRALCIGGVAYSFSTINHSDTSQFWASVSSCMCEWVYNAFL